MIRAPTSRRKRSASTWAANEANSKANTSRRMPPALDIPASSIAPQPLPETEFTGFPVSTGRRVATCAVSTGLEASWVLDYTLTDDGWRCAAVKGPLEGGYRVHEGKPEEQM